MEALARRGPVKFSTKSAPATTGASHSDDFGIRSAADSMPTLSTFEADTLARTAVILACISAKRPALAVPIRMDAHVDLVGTMRDGVGSLCGLAVAAVLAAEEAQTIANF
jgi:hypothetical protein